jgi:TonB family protein
MTDLAAGTASLTVRRRAHGAVLALAPELELGAGGEARVYAVPGDPTLVAKIYHHPTLDRARKLARMIAEPPELPEGGGASLAWPLDLLMGPSQRFAGFVMPRAEGPRVFELYNPVTRRRQSPLFHYGQLHRAGRNLAAAFAALHERGYVVGDVNESNILLSRGAVTLVDTDSFQVRDGAELFRSKVGKAEFTPPELQGVNFADVDRVPEHDRFGLAVLLFLVLMEGTHPFAARFRPGEETPPVEDRIRRGWFPHGLGEVDGLPCLPPRLAPPFATLDPALRALFVRAFVDGHADPAARPDAAAWRDALEAAEAALAVCAKNPQHRYGEHLEECPWCARSALLHGRDPFPATVEAALRTEGTALVAVGAPRGRRGIMAPARLPGLTPMAQAAAVAPAAPVILPTGWRAVTGPAGLANPGVWLFPLFVLMAAAASEGLKLMAALGVIAAVAGLWRRGGFGIIRPISFGLMFLLSLLAFQMALATHAAPDPDPVLYPGWEPEPYTAPAPPVDIGVQPGEPVPAELSAADVESQPELLNQEELEEAVAAEYPAVLRDAGVTGEVELSFMVRADGTVDPATVETVDATHELFADAARDAVLSARFRPAEIGGSPVAMRITLPVAFVPGEPY